MSGHRRMNYERCTLMDFIFIKLKFVVGGYYYTNYVRRTSFLFQ
jgi:hypothetical protein